MTLIQLDTLFIKSLILEAWYRISHYFDISDTPWPIRSANNILGFTPSLQLFRYKIVYNQNAPNVMSAIEHVWVSLCHVTCLRACALEFLCELMHMFICRLHPHELTRTEPLALVLQQENQLLHTVHAVQRYFIYPRHAQLQITSHNEVQCCGRQRSPYSHIKYIIQCVTFAI